MIYTINAVISSSFYQLKQSFSRPTFRFVIILQPLLYGYLLFLMYSHSNPTNLGEKIIIGTGLMNLWSSILYSSASDLERERSMGTLEAIYSAPVDFKIILLGKIIGNITLGIISTLISFVFITLVLNLHIQITNPFLFSVSYIATIITFIIISLICSLIFTLSRNSRLLMNCLEYPFFILCGFVFPITLLPKQVQYLSYLLTPTWSTLMLKKSMTGINHTYFAKYLFIFGFENIIYLLIIFHLFKKFDSAIRSKGRLGLY
ncbi:MULTISPECIES: ABC transporter permease [unclassified Paenibacillus]